MEQYYATILMFAGNFAPVGTLFCDGQLMPISSNTALFSLIGTTYGGNGSTTFALPDMRGRVPMHPGQGSGLTNRLLGEKGGEEKVSLNASQMPAHVHAVVGSGAASTYESGKVLSNSASIYTDVPPTWALGNPTGGGQQHSNLQPYLCVNFVICTQGIYPSRP
jgi:microcystin-dependent protein